MSFAVSNAKCVCIAMIPIAGLFTYPIAALPHPTVADTKSCIIYSYQTEAKENDDLSLGLKTILIFPSSYLDQ